MKTRSPLMNVTVVATGVSPKANALNATIGVNRCVIDRIYSLKQLTVQVKAGRAVQNYRVVKSDGPNDLVFQPVKDGKPIRDNNILPIHQARRKKAGIELGELAKSQDVALGVVEIGRS